jgi:hypothetical protein
MHYLCTRHAEEQVSDLGMLICPKRGNDLSTPGATRGIAAPVHAAVSVVRNIDAVQDLRRINQSVRTSLKFEAFPVYD